MAQYVDNPWPSDLKLVPLRKLSPSREKQLANLQRSGRKKGTLNRINRDLREGVINAAATHGFDGLGAGSLDGYLYLLASENRRLFVDLLTKLLPLTVNSNANTTSASVSRIQIVGVPSGRHFNAEELARIERGENLLDILQSSEPSEAPPAIAHEEAPPKEPIAPESETMTRAEMQLLTELNASLEKLARAAGVSLANE